MSHTHYSLVALPLIIDVKHELIADALYNSGMGPAPFDREIDGAEDAFDAKYGLAWIDDDSFDIEHKPNASAHNSVAHEIPRDEFHPFFISPSERSWSKVGDSDLKRLTAFIQAFAVEPQFPYILQTTSGESGGYGHYKDKGNVELVFLFPDGHYVLKQGSSKYQSSIGSCGRYGGFAEILAQDRELLARLSASSTFDDR